MMHLYTVVLLYPQSCFETDDSEPRFEFNDSYTAVGIRALNPGEAFAKAQKEAFKQLDKESKEGLKPTDFIKLVVFEGKHQPVLFGWQPH